MKPQDIRIRKTTPEDFNDVIKVEGLAFDYNGVEILAGELLTDTTAEPIVSLLAFHKNKPVGHILFTRASLEGCPDDPMVHILAPLAVIPEYQNEGIGGMLIDEGLRLLRDMGSHIVFVLGHRGYYPRHGFKPYAGRLGYPAPYPIPEKDADCWMVQPVSDDGFDIGKGRVICSEMLDKPEHWRE